ncbi:MAG: NYN domain-containing protein [Chloroflexi bacterium]|nr:NYN domain-containing protein [Chloroflexota bacterium]
MTKRSVIYVDGFNFYYGMVRGTPWKWLNLQRYFELVRQDDDIQELVYFTAQVGGGAGKRQEVYLRALDTLPKARLVVGRYKDKTFTCGVSACPLPGPRRYRGVEEKQTDVGIGVRMVDDAYQGRAERIVVVSGDSDLLPALRLVKHRFPEIEVIVYVPAARGSVRAAAVEMRSVADRARTLPAEPLKRSQFPPVIQTPSGVTITRPPGW